MYMRKWSVCGMAGIMLAASVVMPVSAHGHHHSQTGTNTTKETTSMICEVCTVEGCGKTGLHVHDDVTYCGYDHEDGYCDGSCGAVEVCTVEGCEETGHHTHNQETYCGYAHESGYCDNSCARTAVSGTGKRCGTRRHHAR
ncbi:MAG: hypothetical protein NC416_19730 [Eubacterium sp.]|nr:hypothetical protein [Eubacterium sp.]